MEIKELLGELPEIAELMEMDFTCDFRKLYEVLIMGIKIGYWVYRSTIKIGKVEKKDCCRK